MSGSSGPSVCNFNCAHCFLQPSGYHSIIRSVCWFLATLNSTVCLGCHTGPPTLLYTHSHIDFALHGKYVWYVSPPSSFAPRTPPLLMHLSHTTTLVRSRISAASSVRATVMQSSRTIRLTFVFAFCSYHPCNCPYCQCPYRQRHCFGFGQCSQAVYYSCTHLIEFKRLRKLHADSLTELLVLIIELCSLSMLARTCEAAFGKALVLTAAHCFGEPHSA